MIKKFKKVDFIEKNSKIGWLVIDYEKCGILGFQYENFNILYEK